MARSTNSKANKRIGTHMRGALAPAYEERGTASSKIVATYSLKLREDYVAKSHNRFLHFVLLESNPQIQKIVYNPSTVLSAGALDAADVIALTSNGVVEIIKLYDASALPQTIPSRAFDACVEQLNEGLPKGFAGATRFEFVPIALEKLWIGHEIRIRNWIRLLAAYHECRLYSLVGAQLIFRQNLSSRKTLSLLEVQRLCRDEHEFALMLAAAAEDAAFGRCSSDLHKYELCLNTRFKYLGDYEDA